MDFKKGFHAVFYWLGLSLYRIEKRFGFLEYFLFTFHFGFSIISSLTLQYWKADSIYSFEGNTVLMFLDLIQINGPILGHGLVLLEALFRRKLDAEIHKRISEINRRLLRSPEEEKRTFRKMLSMTAHYAFAMVVSALVIPIYIFVRVIKDKEESSWGKGTLYKMWSLFVTRLYIVMVCYFFAYIASRLDKIREILQENRFEINGYFLKDTKDNVNLLWTLHKLIIKRFSVTFVYIVGLQFCYAIIDIFLLIRRLKLKKFKFLLESLVSMLPNLLSFLALLRVSTVIYIVVSIIIVSLK